MGSVNTANICFDCDNACGGCSWSARFEPVPGWTAEPVTRTATGGKDIDTYRITACPQYKQTVRRKAEDVSTKWLKLILS